MVWVNKIHVVASNFYNSVTSLQHCFCPPPLRYINSMWLYCLVFCLLARCASIRHQLPATFTACKHLDEAFHLLDVVRGPRGSGVMP